MHPPQCHAHAKETQQGMVHAWVGQKVTPINLIVRGGDMCVLRLCSGTFYISQVMTTRRVCNTQHKHTTNITTMVVELPTPLAAWIQ
jgi:hypothetical protein